MSFLSKCVLIYFCLIKTKTKTLFCFCSVNLDAMLTFNMHQNLNAATKNPAFFSDVLQNFLWLAQTHRNVFISYSNKQYHLLRTERPNQQHGVLSKATLCVCVCWVWKDFPTVFGHPSRKMLVINNIQLWKLDMCSQRLLKS